MEGMRVKTARPEERDNASRRVFTSVFCKKRGFLHEEKTLFT